MTNNPATPQPKDQITDGALLHFLQRASPALRRRAVMAFPYAWMILLFAAPLLIVLFISLSTAALTAPPYEPFVKLADGALIIKPNISNYHLIVEDSFYLHAFVTSLQVALVTTLICLFLGYPMAYAIARAPKDKRPLLLMLAILPFWTSLLIRVYAWIGLLQNQGLVNDALRALGFITEPINFMYTDFAMYIGLVYTYLPFMVLPLYATLEKLDTTLLEAAGDLGAKPFYSFLSVTLPLSLPGIVAGAMLVFIPVVGEFVVPELLGNPNNMMIGTVIWKEFFTNRDWPVAAALTIIMLTVLLVPIVIGQVMQARAVAAASSMKGARRA
jgi:putrescine transport system permease protein